VSGTCFTHTTTSMTTSVLCDNDQIALPWYRRM
jgi:hypothetical protein